MLFSVIIPTYNRRALLAQALASVRAQVCTDYEIIVVDDGSTDGTREWLAAEQRDVRVLVQNNQGPGAARNLAAQVSVAEYLAFLDSDDLWLPWSLSVYVGVLERNPRSVLLAGKPFLFHREEEIASVQYADAATQCFEDYLASGDKWRWWGASSFVVERRAFLAAGGFAAARMNCEDADLVLKLGTAGGFVQVVAPYTFAYRTHDGNITMDIIRSLVGALQMVANEISGVYPGGSARARERREIIMRHIRPIMLSALRHRVWRKAWQIYFATWLWSARQMRVRFLAGFPALAVWQLLHPRPVKHAA
jgi:glycosyltransferase involved in cell wall biosynthesis